MMDDHVMAHTMVMTVHYMISIGDMPTRGPGRKTQAFLRAAAQLRREAPPYCAGCGRYIDRDLPATDAWSWTADHEPDITTLIALGLDPDDIRYLRPMHRTCNSSKGDRRPAEPINTSRRW